MACYVMDSGDFLSFCRGMLAVNKYDIVVKSGISGTRNYLWRFLECLREFPILYRCRMER